MLTTTNGIILNKHKYGDNSIICNVYTKEYGKQHYILRNSFAKKQKNIYISPFQIMEFEIYYKSEKTLLKIKSANSSYTFKELPFNIYKNSIAIFIAQILEQLVQEESPNEDLYKYINDSIIFLDTTNSSFSNFHLFFLINLSKFLGYYPEDNYSEQNCYFNLEKGCFENEITTNILGENISKIIHQLINTQLSELNNIKLNQTSRNAILDCLIYFFEIHSFQTIKCKSLAISRELFS